MEAPAPRTTTRELTDADAIHDYLVTTYGTAMRMTCTDERYLFHHRRTDAGSFAMESVDHFNLLDFAVDPLRRLVVVRVSTARLERCSGRTDGRYATDDLFLVAEPDRPYTLRWLPGAITTCVIDPALLARVAAPAPGRRPEPIRFTGLDPRSPTAAAHWWNTRLYVAGLLDNPEAAAVPLLVDSAAQLLAAATLATFPNTALVDPTIEDRRDASGTTLRRAVGYIEDHAARDVSLAGIAEAAHVSVRAVQLAFRRHFDTTPMAYLRRVRLDHAHRALIAADPEKTTVAAVAAQWGFANHSRFTAIYRATYGVLPSATLRGSS
jgi:AraC-like DNA-binding protein